MAELTPEHMRRREVLRGVSREEHMTQTADRPEVGQDIPAFPASRKVYQAGDQPGVRVPFREIEQSPTKGRYGDSENPPLRVYDTSGLYTDPDVALDIHKGLPTLRRHWV